MDYLQNLERWIELKESLKRLTDEERGLRQALFDGTFPKPVEGTNNYELPDGRIVKGVYKINRTVEDTEGVAALPKATRDAYFRTKYDLKTSAYKELDDERRAMIDKYIVAKPGLPNLEVVPGKKKQQEVQP